MQPFKWTITSCICNEHADKEVKQKFLSNKEIRRKIIYLMP